MLTSRTLRHRCHTNNWMKLRAMLILRRVHPFQIWLHPIHRESPSFSKEHTIGINRSCIISFMWFDWIPMSLQRWPSLCLRIIHQFIYCKIWLVHANMVFKRSWKLLSSSPSSSRYKCEKSNTRQLRRLYIHSTVQTFVLKVIVVIYNLTLSAWGAPKCKTDSKSQNRGSRNVDCHLISGNGGNIFFCIWTCSRWPFFFVNGRSRLWLNTCPHWCAWDISIEITSI